jgi:hypothetical protein
MQAHISPNKGVSNSAQKDTYAGVKLKLFCPEAKNSSPLFKFIEELI